MAGLMKILPMFMMVMPGMVSRVLYPNEIACTNPDYCMQVCQSKAGCTNIAYPKLVLGLMPEGARGLMMAVMIAALMSDLDSIFNSASTLFTMDVWKHIRKRANNMELMIVGRLFICVMVGISIAWVPVIKETQRGQVFIYIQEVTNYLAPPFAAIFLLAVLVPFVNETGAFWALMLALLTGVVRLFSVLILKGEEYCGSVDTYPEPPILKEFHYMYFSFFITAMTAVVAIVISLLTGKPDDHLLYRTTFWTRHKTESQPIPGLDSTELQIIMDNNKMNGDGEQDPLDTGHINTGTTNETNSDGQDVKHFRDPEIEMASENGNEVPRHLQIIRFICGVTNEKQEEKNIAAMKAHLEKIASLKQRKGEKCVLTIGLICLIITGMSMYLYWSMYDFDPSPFYPEGAKHLLPGDKV